MFCFALADFCNMQHWKYTMNVWDLLQFILTQSECYWLFCHLVIFRYRILVNREEQLEQRRKEMCNAEKKSKNVFGLETGKTVFRC